MKVDDKLFPLSIDDQLDTGWQLGDAAERKVFAKLMAGGRPLGEAVNGQMYRGILTGLNEVFIIGTATRDRLVKEDPKCAEIIKPIVRGEDLRPWYQEDEGRWLVVLKSSGDHSWPWSGAEDPEAAFQQAYPSMHAHVKPMEARLRKRQDKGRHWWELRSCSYYGAFEGTKVFWPDITKFPRFSRNDVETYVNDKGFLLPLRHHFILGVLQSRASWLCVSQLCVPFGERAGLNRYQQKTQFISLLPVPEASEEEREAVGSLAMEITENARARYELHERTRRRIFSDLGKPGKKLNQKLTAWWTLDFPAFRAEAKKVFKGDIPLAERNEWDEWLAEQRAEHLRLTAEIVRLETELNAHVYALFDLTPEEIEVIEESTKFRYGEV